MATATELLRAAEHMRKLSSVQRDTGLPSMADASHRAADALEREAQRLQAIEATSRRGGAAYMSDLRDDERKAVIDSMGSGFAPGSPRGWRDGRVVFSHLIDPTTRAPRCAGHMYHGDSVAIDCEPTCPGCLQWRSQNRSWPEGWPPFAVLRRAYELLDVTPTPSLLWLERHGRGDELGLRRRWARALELVLEEGACR